MWKWGYQKLLLRKKIIYITDCIIKKYILKVNAIYGIKFHHRQGLCWDGFTQLFWDGITNSVGLDLVYATHNFGTAILNGADLITKTI